MATFRYQVGTKVRPTERAFTEYGGTHRFPAGWWMNMIGVVIEDSNEIVFIHVDWGEGFIGHGRLDRQTHNGHCWYMEEDMIEVISRPDEPIESASNVTINPSDIPVIPRLRVTITRDSEGYNQWTLKIENGPEPNKTEVMAYMDKGLVRKMGSRLWSSYDLNRFIHKGIEEYGIDPQAFIDAITEASLAKQSREATGVFQRSVYDSELQTALGSGPAIIAIGDQLFSLHPRGVVKSGRAIGTLREKIVKVAKDQAARIKAAAKAEADGLIANGERQLKEARAKIERELAPTRTQLTLPQWIADNYIKVKRWYSPTFTMSVGIEVNTKIKAFQLVDEGRRKTIRWEGECIKILPAYHTVTIWMPFEPISGIYSYKLAKIVGNGYHDDYILPHLTTSRCCMDLQGLPEKMVDIDSYNKIVKVINRGNEEVNMKSLLGKFPYWHPDIQEQVPVGLKKLIDIDGYLSHNIPEEYLTEAIRIPIDDEARGVFNVDSLREARVAEGIELPEIALIGDMIDGVEAVEVEADEENDHPIVVDVDEDVDRDEEALGR